jgi:PII-like signaling protein
LLMSTGLTFGMISALFVLNNGKIDERQYSVLVAVVIAGAVVATVIAQAFFERGVTPAVGGLAVRPAQLGGPPGRNGAPATPAPEENGQAAPAPPGGRNGRWLMKLEGEQTLLRVFLQNTDKASWWTNAQDALLKRAMGRNLEGATSQEGSCGLVAGETVECGRWAFVEHHPVILEFLDSPTAIGGFLDDVVAVAPRALATLERAHVLAYRKREQEAALVASRLEVPGRVEEEAYLPSPEEFPLMRTTVEGQLLRVFIDDADKFQGQPLYWAVIEKAREVGFMNAVVIRAPKGFGTHQRLHSDSFPDYITELPVIIELVGTAEEVGRLLPFLDEAVPEGLLTVEAVKMLLPRAGGS